MAKKYRYIAMVETRRDGHVEQWGEGKDGHSLSSSGRWTDKRLRSSKKNAETVAEQLAAGFNKKDKARPYVRSVVLDDEDLPSKPRRSGATTGKKTTETKAKTSTSRKQTTKPATKSKTTTSRSIQTKQTATKTKKKGK